MIGSTYANAGYVGLHPVRIGRGKLREGAIAINAHTFLCLDAGKTDACYDGLVGDRERASYAKIHRGSRNVVSCAKGYRALAGWVAGRIYFPQGPLDDVQLRIPYLKMKRKGFSQSRPAK